MTQVPAMPAPPALDAAEAREVLESCVRRTGVAGAQLSIMTPGDRVDVACGWADASRGVAMTTTSRSQAGSFAKLLNAVLVHQLVDEGRLALSDPVTELAAEYGEDWPGLDDVRIGQLLSMTSGLDWGIWATGGTVSEALRPQLSLPPRDLPGSSFGYTFAGTLVAARMVELVRRRPWWQCVDELVAEPLGVALSAAAPADDVSAAHTPGAQGWSTSMPPVLPGMGPTGTTLISSAADLATVASSIAGSGPPLLTPGSRTTLHAGVADVHALMVADTWCHGPYSRDVGAGRRLHGHGGRWAGGLCDVTWDAVTGTSVAVLTNTPSRGGALVLEVSREIHRRLWGDVAFLEQSWTEPAADLDVLAGTYVTATRRYDVNRRGDRLVVRATSVPLPDAVFQLPDSTVEVAAIGERRFLPVEEGRDERRLQELWFSMEEVPAYFYDGFVGARRDSATTADNAAGS